MRVVQRDLKRRVTVEMGHILYEYPESRCDLVVQSCFEIVLELVLWPLILIQGIDSIWTWILLEEVLIYG
jgi:hypothetical protein